MTTPTQAQIEASAKAMQERHKDRGYDMNWYRKMAETALTAAAEVGEKEFDLRWNADMRAIKQWQKETGKELTWPNHADLCVWLLNRLDATIERCAQVAEDFPAATFPPTAKAIAAAIRALKQTEGK